MKGLRIIFWMIAALLVAGIITAPAMAADPIKIGIIQGLSGPYEIYGKAEVTGFKMGLEYFTKGSNKINGRDVKLFVEDSQIKAARAKMLLTIVVGLAAGAAVLSLSSLPLPQHNSECVRCAKMWLPLIPSSVVPHASARPNTSVSTW